VAGSAHWRAEYGPPAFAAFFKRRGSIALIHPPITSATARRTEQQPSHATAQWNTGVKNYTLLLKATELPRSMNCFTWQ
jgi:hypothetical protein